MAENEAIGTIASELVSIAMEHGYEGPQDLTIAGAIDALADTLAGSDVDSGRTIAEAVRALAPYVGGGGSVPANYAVFDGAFDGGGVLAGDKSVFDSYATEVYLRDVTSVQSGGPFGYTNALRKIVLPSVQLLSGGGIHPSSPSDVSVFLPSIVTMSPGSIGASVHIHVYFGPDLATIADKAFYGDKWSESTINCAFSEADAPAGVKDALVATGATINYNVPVSEWPM